MPGTVKIPACWQPERIEKAVSFRAKLDQKQVDYFLACHSPITRIRDDHDNRNLNEEDLFKRLVHARQRDVQAVVYGEAGTGKSHLIHWLKLRSDDGMRRGELRNCVVVLIERRSGSLKDALEQLIGQLVASCGEEFRRYLDPVRQAFDRVSEATARQKLLLEVATELGSRWQDRERPKLPKLLAHLGEACRSEGFGAKWLGRDEGVIARRVSLLTDASEVSDRDVRPRFSERDLLIPAIHRKPLENSEQVIQLAVELDDDVRLREQAAEFLNTALESAVVELTGLSGANLRRVFDAVRAELERRGQRLLLFVEDVSVMAELDVEVINALEPQDRLDLCPLTAVLGMTQTGFGRLRPNQLQRIQIKVRVGDEACREWANDAEELATFAARYMNAIRLPEDRVQLLAERRRENGGDVDVSACTDCASRKECHARFGKVTLNGVDIGLFPLSPYAPHSLLQRLAVDERTGVVRTQRGFLSFILTRVLDDVGALASGVFPRLESLPVRVGSPVYWTEFQRQYCGGWPGNEQDRLRGLAASWIPEVGTAAEAAGELKPFLEPLGFRSFSKQARKEPSGEAEKPKEPERPVKPKRRSEANRLGNVLQELHEWRERNAPLRSDPELRRMVATLLRNSVPWEQYRDPPNVEYLGRLNPKGKEKYEFVHIEGQVSDPKTTLFFIRLPRDEETRALLEALVRFEYQGQKSWDFEDGGGETHKRVVARWIRRHADDVMAQVRPPPPCDYEKPIRCATGLLCLGALLRRRTRLPQTHAELLGELFTPFGNGKPLALSRRWKELLEDLQQMLPEVREFLGAELAVIQGRDGGISFIDPRPILNAAMDFRKECRIDPLPEDYLQKFWKSRYSRLQRTGAYAQLPEILTQEREAIAKEARKVTAILAEYGYDTENASEGWLTLCGDLMDLRATEKQHLDVYAPEFAALLDSGAFREKAAAWGRALQQALEVSASDDVTEVILFSPDDLLALVAAAEKARAYLQILSRELATQEESLRAEGDPLALHQEVLGLLTGLTTLIRGEKEKDGDGAD